MKKNSHQALAVRLLRDSGDFFDSLASHNPNLGDQMSENSRVYQKLADLLEEDLLSEFGEDGSTRAELAGKLLHDAAGFFIELSEQNLTLKEQMIENANVYRQVGTLISRDPHGVLDEDDRAPQPDNLIDPLIQVSARADHPCLDAAPEIGISYSCKGHPIHSQRIGTETDRALGHFCGAVLKRDEYTCAFCGFQSLKYQEVVAPSGGFAASQMVCACIFCAQVGALDLAAQFRSATIIWLPEITQTRLNAWMRAIYVARISQGQSAVKARNSLDALRERRAEAELRIGTSDPSILADELAALPGPDSYRRRIDSLSEMRIMPLDRRIIKEKELEFNQFPQILAYWRSNDGPFGGIKPQLMDFSELEPLVEKINLSRTA